LSDVKLVPAKCPSCGAGLQIPEGQDKMHCIYCGSQVFVRKSHPGGQECKVCDGFGRIDICRACNGTGKCTWYMSSSAHGNNDFTSMMAYGSQSQCVKGYCSACGGKGQGGSMSACPFCGGTGKCPRCLGTAKCSACRGIGVIPGPSGSLVCPGCGGEGHLDEKPPEPPELDKCPECGKAMGPGMSFCANCGHSRACPRCGSAWPKWSPLCPWCGFKKGGKV